jgi:hypothetical protein
MILWCTLSIVHSAIDSPVIFGIPLIVVCSIIYINDVISCRDIVCLHCGRYILTIILPVLHHGLNMISLPCGKILLILGMSYLVCREFIVILSPSNSNLTQIMRFLISVCGFSLILLINILINCSSSLYFGYIGFSIDSIKISHHTNNYYIFNSCMYSAISFARFSGVPGLR